MPARRRLNLFAFPPETNALFSMLIITAIMLALFLGQVMGVFFNIPGFRVQMDSSSRGLEITAAYLPFVILLGTILLLVLGVAFLFYLRHPSAIRRGRNIKPIEEKDRDIKAHVNALAIHAGIEPPEIEMPLRGLRGTDAQAFGIGRAQIVGLDGGFRILRKTRPDIFTALLHHELAHFANGDIGRSYFSEALWKSLRCVIVLPFLFGLIGRVITGVILGIRYDDLISRLTGPALLILNLLVQFGFVVLVSGLIWARLLRTREFYADWRAVLWGSQAGLKKIFQEEIESNKPGARFKLLKFHPNAGERIDAMEHPELLFKLSPLIIFLTGLLLSFLFAGLYFELAAFITFAGVMQSIRDSSTGLLYWLVRGVFWGGIVSLFLVIMGLAGGLINGVLLPQIQKQTILELVSKQRGMMPYLNLLLSASMFVVGIEFGFFMTPLSPYTPKELWGFVQEIFIVAPILILTAWWYFIYIRFISLRVSATQIGKNFFTWRRRFIHTSSVLWVFLFLMPGLLLSRFLRGEFLEPFLYAIMIWLIFTVLFSLALFAGSWAIIKFFFENESKKCPHCGKITSHTSPAIEFCEHCEGVLGEWLFVPEQTQIS